jgi:hypothetical protein
MQPDKTKYDDIDMILLNFLLVKPKKVASRFTRRRKWKFIEQIIGNFYEFY